jgi:hypothetical protein
MGEFFSIAFGFTFFFLMMGLFFSMFAQTAEAIWAMFNPGTWVVTFICSCILTGCIML